MTFDEALYKLVMLSEFVGVSSNYRDDFVITATEAQDIILELRDTYMPMIEMKQTQYNFLVGSDGLVDVIGNITVDGVVKEYFDEDFWKPLNERDVAKAWLNPETIKVVK